MPSHTPGPTWRISSRALPNTAVPGGYSRTMHGRPSNQLGPSVPSEEIARKPAHWLVNVPSPLKYLPFQIALDVLVLIRGCLVLAITSTMPLPRPGGVETMQAEAKMPFNSSMPRHLSCSMLVMHG